MTLATSGAIAAAASQSTVFVTMVDEGGTGGTGGVGGSISGSVFGLSVSSVSYLNPGLIVDLAGSASGQSFFRTVRVVASNGSVAATLNTSTATSYNSANNAWTWNSGSVGAGSYTLQFFR